MSESYAGITVPEGEPAALEGAAGRFATLGHTLTGVATEVRSTPGTMAAWQGPASVSFAGACLTTSGATDQAVDALAQCSQAARQYATALEDAQTRAREAIEAARDAQRRIDQAERDIAAARDRRAAAADQIRNAETEIDVAAAAGTPAPGAEAARTDGYAAQWAAESDEQAAQRELERARDDLERAQRKGREAEEDARAAGRAAASAFHGAAGISPAYALIGGPAMHIGGGNGGPPSWWDTTNEGNPHWDEDQFLGQLLFFHPENDTLGATKWWGDRASDVGFDWASGAAVAHGLRMRQNAITAQRFIDVSRSRVFVSGPGGTVLAERITMRPTTATVIDADQFARAGQWARAGRALPIVGGAVSVASAGWDQWRQDASNPNLTTTDRVGRAAGVGVYVGGASVAGAAIGTMIFPGVGTVAGLAIGAAGGLIVGAVASSITPVKEFMADTGAVVANATVDAVEWTGDRMEDLGEGLQDMGEGIAEGVGDLVDDLPDLNPF